MTSQSSETSAALPLHARQFTGEQVELLARIAHEANRAWLRGAARALA
jgi:hypothetical protein